MKVIVDRTMNCPANLAWEKLSMLKGMEEYSMVERSEVVGEGVGATRICVMPDGGEVHERVLTMEQEQMTMSYAVEKSPFPVSDCTGKVSVEAIAAGSCKVQWEAEFQPMGGIPEEALQSALGGFYVNALEQLEGLIEKMASEMNA